MKETRMEITHRIRLCKACGMCSKSCPAQINIPEALGIYKEYLAGDTGILEKLDEMESPGKPVTVSNAAHVLRIVRTVWM